MPTITAIRPQKRGNRVNLFLDGHFAFALAKETAQGLEVGKELPPGQLQALTKKDALERARDFSLRLLSYRPRSEKEVRERLGRHGFPPETVEQTIACLKDQGLLDEGAFARFWREGREASSPRSRRLIELELRRKGVDPELARDAVQDLDEEESALRAARRKARSLKGLDEETFRKKMLSYLQRRGFSWELSRRTLAKLKEASGGAPIE
jgi:regulatory protein